MRHATSQEQDANGFPIDGLVVSPAWPVYIAGSTSAVATKTGVANTRHVVTGVWAVTDLASAPLTIAVDSSTVAAAVIGTTGAHVIELPTPLECTLGKTVTATVTGTSACSVTMFGYTLLAIPAG